MNYQKTIFLLEKCCTFFYMFPKLGVFLIFCFCICFCKIGQWVGSGGSKGGAIGGAIAPPQR